MKKILLVIMSLLILTGCSNENKEVEIDDKYYKQYQKYEEKLNEAKDFETEITD
ncbi:membrane lipoprotein lipid attachment site-containing protein, partial [Thomasclavelia sp.]